MRHRDVSYLETVRGAERIDDDCSQWTLLCLGAAPPGVQCGPGVHMPRSDGFRSRDALGATCAGQRDARHRAGCREFAPDTVVVTGPGTTLGGAVAQTLIGDGWHWIDSKAAFVTLQADAPFVLSMGLPAQRALAVHG